MTRDQLLADARRAFETCFPDRAEEMIKALAAELIRAQAEGVERAEDSCDRLERADRAMLRGIAADLRKAADALTE